VGLVIPAGYSFNLDAFSIYITLAAVFIAQTTDTPISMTDLLTILAISLVTSKGAHGVPGSAIVVLAAWEGDIDRARAHAVLDGRPVTDDAETAELAALAR
jgi:aerobic C4-dicarboxylate transport protein